MEDRFCTHVAQGFTFAESSRRAGYKAEVMPEQLLANPIILRTIVNRIRIHKKDVGAIELLSKGKQRLNELMDSPDEKIVLGAASSVLKVFSGPGRKTLMEKAIEEDVKVADLAALARDLLPKTVIIDAEVIEEPKLIAENTDKRND